MKLHYEQLWPTKQVMAGSKLYWIFDVNGNNIPVERSIYALTLPCSNSLFTFCQDVV